MAAALHRLRSWIKFVAAWPIGHFQRLRQPPFRPRPSGKSAERYRAQVHGMELQVIFLLTNPLDRTIIAVLYNTAMQEEQTQMEERSTATLENIQRAAMEEFSEKGFLGASLRKIVKNAGVTTGAFYG